MTARDSVVDGRYLVLGGSGRAGSLAVSLLLERVL